MERSTSEILLKIKDKAMDDLSGRMAESTKVNGRKESNMGLVFIETPKEKKGRANGSKVKGPNGLTESLYKLIINMNC